jgi:hypothetical protein
MIAQGVEWIFAVVFAALGWIVGSLIRFLIFLWSSIVEGFMIGLGKRQ